MDQREPLSLREADVEMVNVWWNDIRCSADARSNVQDIIC